MEANGPSRVRVHGPDCPRYPDESKRRSIGTDKGPGYNLIRLAEKLP